MATEISLDDAFGPTAERKPPFVPADRTSKQKSSSLTLDDVGGRSKVRGTLPKDRKIYDTIRSSAKEFGVPEEYVFALAEQESSYNPAAFNGEYGARGIMQYIPETARNRGIDPSDPVASIRAAAEDFANAMNEGGVEWAIKHHFAGPDVKGHGPKTRQYLADVSQRAADIRALLDQEGFEEELTPGTVVAGGSDSGPKQRVLSLDEAFGTTATPQEQEEPEMDLIDKAKKYVGEPIMDVAERGWDAVKNRLFNAPQRIERSEQEIIKAIEERYKGTPSWDSPKRRAELIETFKNHDFFKYTQPMASAEEVSKFEEGQKGEAAEFAELEKSLEGKSSWQRYLGYTGNPVDAILNESIPAHIFQAEARGPIFERQRYEKVKDRLRNEEVVKNPAKHSAAVVAAAQQAIDQEDSKKDPSITEQWNDLKKAATEDPAKFAGTLTRAIVADPEMLAAPIGVGLKPLQAARAANTVSRVTKTIDKVIDAGSTGAALNLGMEAASAEAEGRHLTGNEAVMAGGIGFVLSGSLGGLLSKSGAAKAKLKNGEVDFDTILRDAAKEELAADDILRSTQPIDANVKHQIEQSTGVKFESDADLKTYLETSRKEWKKLFSERDLNGQYQKALAEERMQRRAVLEQERARRESELDALGEESSVEAAWLEHQGKRTATAADDYERALAQREAQRAGEQSRDYDAAEAQLKKATAKLDEEEMFEAAINSNVPAIRQAMQRAVQRDAKLRLPKWQRGEVDSRVLFRLGLGSLWAGTAFAVAPEDKKLATAFAAGLAGLTVPGIGGSISRKLRKQGGVISAEGDIVGLLVKEGKLKAERTADEVISRENELIAAAKKGDQKAYQELYNEYAPRIQRYVKKYVREAGPKLGIEAEDVAQEAFVKAFKNLDSYKGGSSFSTWLHAVAKNEGLMAIRDAKTLKGGGEFEVQSAEMPDVRDPYGEVYSRDAFDEGAGANLDDTPENQALRQEAEGLLLNAVEALPEAQKKAFILSRVEQYTAQEIADMTDQNLSTVLMQIKTAQDKVLEAIAKGTGAKRTTPKINVEPEIKRGRGRPPGSKNRPRIAAEQTGSIDPRMLVIGGALSFGAGAGFFLNEQNRLAGAGIGALTSILLMAKGRKGLSTGQQMLKAADYTLGITSTRIMNKSKALWRKAIEHERIVLRDVHKNLQAVDPFLVRLQKLPKETNALLSRAILTGKPEVTNKLLEAIGDKDLISGWKAVRSTLDSLRDQLVALKRFKPGQLDYFPRVVRDIDGLLKAMGKERGSFLEEALRSAETEAIRSRGTGLTDLEKSLVINKILKEDKNKSQQPDFAKNRVIEEITPELQPFYYSPTESMHSYIRSAVEDIQRAKFFGEDLKIIKKEGKEYTNVDQSIGTLVQRLMNEGKLTGKDAEEVAGLLKSRFINGERAPSEIIQASKNLSYAGLLGNPFSAAVQLGDTIIQAYTQDIRSTLGAVTRKLTGRKIVSMKDFGLSDHIAEEFVSTSRSAKFLNKVFKYSLFKGVDEFGKDIALNAAILRNRRLALNPKGIEKLAEKYMEAMGPTEFEALVKDLQKGEPTDLVRSVAFAELSRTQPITRLELPQAYLDNPNGRLLYQYKTFMLKQIDLARRDGYNEIKSGRVARGMRQLTELGLVLGVAGTTTSKIKDFMLDKDIDLSASDIPMNMLKTFGLSEYFRDHFFGVSKDEAAARRKSGDKTARAVKAEPLRTAIGMFTPPAKMFDEIVRQDPKAVRYIPFVGPLLYEQMKSETKK